MENADNLNKANHIDDPMMRLLLVSGFSIAQYVSTKDRTGKPFLPVLGETFELKAKNWRYITE